MGVAWLLGLDGVGHFLFLVFSGFVCHSVLSFCFVILFCHSVLSFCFVILFCHSVLSLVVATLPSSLNKHTCMYLI